MKAFVFTRYGTPDVLELKEVDKPEPKEDEVLIKIHATTVNRTDCGLRKPEPFITRVYMGLLKPRMNVLGSEFAGVVEKAGPEVKSVQPGDRIFGLSTKTYGTHAEYVCLPESGSLTSMPDNLSFEEAAAVCDGMMLAMTYIGKIDFNQRTKILIYGASGSIGTAGVQLAKYYGVFVTAVCSTKDVDLVESLGADEVIDYTREDFKAIGRIYDVIFDAVGKTTYFHCKKLLAPGGTYFSTDLGPWSQNIFLSLWTSLFGGVPFGQKGRKVRFPLPSDSKEDVLFYKKLLENGDYKPVIDRRYPLKELVEACKYVETGQKTGNVVINVK